MQNTTSSKLRIGTIAGFMSLTFLGNAHAENLQGVYQKMLGLANSMQQEASAQGLSNTYADKLSSNFGQLENNLKRGMGISRNLQLGSTSNSSDLLIEVAAVAASTGAIHEFSAEAQQNIANEISRISPTLADDGLAADAEEILATLEGRTPVRTHVPYARRTARLGRVSPATVNTYRNQLPVSRPLGSSRAPNTPYKSSPVGVNATSKNAQLHQELSRGVSVTSLNVTQQSSAAVASPASSKPDGFRSKSSKSASAPAVAPSAPSVSATAAPASVGTVPSPSVDAAGPATSTPDASAPQAATKVSNPAARARWMTAFKGVKDKRAADANKPAEQDTSGAPDFERTSKDHDEDAENRKKLKEAFKAEKAAKKAAAEAAKAKAETAQQESTTSGAPAVSHKSSNLRNLKSAILATTRSTTSREEPIPTNVDSALSLSIADVHAPKSTPETFEHENPLYKHGKKEGTSVALTSVAPAGEGPVKDKRVVTTLDGYKNSSLRNSLLSKKGKPAAKAGGDAANNTSASAPVDEAPIQTKTVVIPDAAGPIPSVSNSKAQLNNSDNEGRAAFSPSVVSTGRAKGGN